MEAATVRQGLERILASTGFDASERNRRFLAYIVGETLAGRADRLKGVTIAIDVFGRDAPRSIRNTTRWSASRPPSCAAAWNATT